MIDRINGCLKHIGVRGRSIFAQDKGTPYVPTKPSAEANICLTCDPNKKCKGNCERYRQAHKKLKEQNNERL